MVAIKLKCGRETLIDDADVERVTRYAWRSQRSAQRDERFYAYTYAEGRKVYLHRLILSPPDDVLVDHKNGNGLDNRRVNLREATRSANNANRALANPSGYRGVVALPSGRFRAIISAEKRPLCGDKNQVLGKFDTAEEAAHAYDRAALERWGDFARLNFPQQKAAA